MVTNLKLEWGDKSLDYLNGEPFRVRVVLRNDDGAYYPVFFDPQEIDKPDTELLEQALNAVYEKNFSTRAENEKFNEIGEKIAKYDELIEKSQKAIRELEQATEASQLATAQNKETVDAAVSELTALVMSLVNNVSFDEETDSEVVED